MFPASVVQIQIIQSCSHQKKNILPNDKNVTQNNGAVTLDFYSNMTAPFCLVCEYSQVTITYVPTKKYRCVETQRYFFSCNQKMPQCGILCDIRYSYTIYSAVSDEQLYLSEGSCTELLLQGCQQTFLRRTFCQLRRFLQNVLL